MVNFPYLWSVQFSAYERRLNDTELAPCSWLLMKREISRDLTKNQKTPLRKTLILNFEKEFCLNSI